MPIDAVYRGPSRCMHPGRIRTAAVVGTLALTGPALAGCGDGRSVQAACRVWDRDGQALHDKFGGIGSGQDLFRNLADLAGAAGRMSLLMTKLADAAPKDVAPAFDQLATALDRMGGNGGDPLAGLVGGLGAALEAQGAAEEVNSFLSRNCGSPG